MNPALHHLTEGAFDAMFGMDRAGTLVLVNPVAEALFGWSSHDVLGKELAEVLIPAEAREAHRKGLAHFLATGEGPALNKRIEVRALRPDGSTFPAELYIRVVQDLEPVHFLARLRDLSEQRQQIRTRQGIESRLSALVQSRDIGILFEDSHKTVLQTNQAFCDIFRIPLAPEALEGQLWEQTRAAARSLLSDPDAFEERLDALIAKRQPESGEELSLTDGRTIRRDYTPIYHDGEYQGQLWFFRDITERKRDEDTLRRNHTLLTALSSVSLNYLRESNISTAFRQLLGSLLEVTQSEYGFLGEVLHSPEGKPFIRTHWITNIAWDDATRALYAQYAPNFDFHNLDTLFGAVVTSGEPVIANDPANDPRSGGLPPGHPALNHFLGIPIYIGYDLVGMAGIANRPGGYDPSMVVWLQPFLSACANLIQSYRSQKAQHETESRLRRERDFTKTILDTIGALVMVLDGEGRVVSFNRACQQVTGYTLDDIQGTYLWRLPFVPRLQQAMARKFWRTFDGSWYPDGWEAEWYHKTEESSTIAWTNRVLRDDEGKVAYVISAGMDVTSQRRTEQEREAALIRLRETTSELERSNQALQDFASVASHDLQEPLRKIQSFGGRLKVKHADALGTDGQDYLNRMLSAERMQSLIQDLLAYSRVTTKARPFVSLSLEEIVQGVLSDLEARLLQTGGVVQVDPLPCLEADPLQMRQLFQNLIGNALKFMKPGEPPVVQITLHPTENTGRLKLTISDNGIGFDPQYAERIFAVFERLHGRNEYEGTGIGLAICRKIMDRHNGTITATSPPEGGAVFTLELPLTQQEKELSP